jgi:hypothetical protein
VHGARRGRARRGRAARSCWRGPARGEPGFAGRQTDTGEEIDIEFTPDNQSIVFAATTNPQRSGVRIHGLAAVRRDVKVASRGRSPRARHWSQPRFTPDGRTLLAVLETQGRVVYNASRIAAFTGPTLASTTSSPRASIVGR